MLSGAVPLFLRVTDSTTGSLPPVVPTTCVPKVRLVGVNVTEGAEACARRLVGQLQTPATRSNGKALRRALRRKAE